ncbi:hypothetical protein [Candidatus Solirubrobacter pratensis]|uniref:hypothetical protein n=1 Tax=Candidatus Solirubrobacter pratensis TaxID=1298857 RepID=UPI00040CA17E|nr:hypothetical protein [Candidatus Solirubrobacter pratensis]
MSFEAIPEDVQKDIEQLEMYGYISDEYRVWGSAYTMRTLKGDEELAAAVVTKEYVETLAQAKSWAWANIALSVDAIDGKHDYCPRVQVDAVEFARARFRYWTSTYTWTLGERLFTEFVTLQRRELAAREAMQDFHVPSPAPFLPGLSSLSDLGISTDELAPEAA